MDVVSTVILFYYIIILTSVFLLQEVPPQPVPSVLQGERRRHWLQEARVDEEMDYFSSYCKN